MVVGHERFGTGQVRATVTENGDLEDAELIFDDESLATVSGRLARDSLGGTFQIGSIESGEWSGGWRGVMPPGEGQAQAEPPEDPHSAKDFRSHSTAIREKIDVLPQNITVEMNRLASEPNDFGTFQVEVEVAVDRSGVSNRVALAAIDAFQFPPPQPASPNLAYYISPDGGDTWPSSLKGVPPGIDDFAYGFDPVIDYDRNGDLYYCGTIEKEVPGTDDQGIFVSRMPAQSDFFQDARIVRLVSSAARTVDKPWCATGVTPGSNPQDIIYVTWVEYEVAADVSTIKSGLLVGRRRFVYRANDRLRSDTDGSILAPSCGKPANALGKLRVARQQDAGHRRYQVRQMQLQRSGCRLAVWKRRDCKDDR